MTWSHALSYFFGGFFLVNAIPHVVSGLMGRPLQTPFAKPPGKGLSSSTVNVVWGWFNLAVGYVLIFQVGAFDLRDAKDVAVVGFAGLIKSLGGARQMGRFHGGNTPLSSGGTPGQPG